MCLGRNYAEHRAESMRAWNEPTTPRPEYPIFFTKAPTAVAAPYADLPFDFKISEQLDWEVELGIVIGKPGKNIKQEDAFDHVFGYVVVNDISVRDVQRQARQPVLQGQELRQFMPLRPLDRHPGRDTAIPQTSSCELA